MQKNIKIFSLLLVLHLSLYSQNQYDLFFKLTYYNAFQIEDSSFLYSNKLISEKKANSSAFYLISLHYFKQGNYPMALNNVNFALEKDNDNLYFNFLKFKILVRLNNYLEAQLVANKILSNTELESIFLDVLYEISFFSNIEFFFKKYTSLFPFSNTFYDICINSLNNNFNQSHFIKFINYLQSYTSVNYQKLKDINIISKNFMSHNELKTVLLSTKSITNNEFLLLLSQIYIENNQYDSSFLYFKMYLENKYSDIISVNNFLNSNKLNIITPNNTYIDSFENILTKNNYNNEYSEFLSDFYFETNDFYNSLFLQKTIVNLSNIEGCIIYLNLLYRFDFYSIMDSLCNELMLLYPFDPYIILFSSISSIFTGNYNKATIYLNKLYLYSLNDSILLSYYYFYNYILKSKLNESSIKDLLTNALQYSSGNNTLQLNFAFYLSKYLKDNKNALEIALNANIPNNSSSLFILSFLYYNNNELNKSLDYINKAIDISKFHNFIYYELKANVLKRLGFNDDAEYFFNLSFKYGNIRVNKNL